MKNALSYFLICLLVLTLNAGNVFSAQEGVSNASKYSLSNYTPIASPLDVIEKLTNTINQLPETAFYTSKKTIQIKKDLKDELSDIMKMLKIGNYGWAKKMLIIDFKKDIKKNIVSKDCSLLLSDIDTILTSIEHACKTTVRTSSGKVAGLRLETGCWTWVGIPFAKPPVGELRWKAPSNPEPWKGVRFSTFDSPRSIQNEITSCWSSANRIIGSEDCLYLNICRPDTEEKNLPVYFWIHGGSNVYGGADDYFWSQMMAKKYNAIVVIVQYRLGIMGWLAHPALNKEGLPSDKAGNYGILDLIKALQWVKGNIEQFGGNPGNVTVAGESSGADNAISLMISPLAKGLFHKVVAESPGTQYISLEKAAENTNSIIEKLLVADKTCADLESAAAYRKSMSNQDIEKYLRSKPAEDFAKLSLSFANTIIDGHVIQETFTSAFESGNYNKVPIILGSNEDEYKPFLLQVLGHFPTSSSHKWSDLLNVLGLTEKTMTLDEVMPPDSDDRAVYETIAKYPSMHWKASMIDAIARSLKKHQDDIYCYYFKWKGKGTNNSSDFIIGAGHTFEMSFFFGWYESMWNNISFSKANEKGRNALKDAVMSYVSSFAASGNPNAVNNSLPKWEKWSNITGEAKSILWDADLDKIRIEMMQEEFKDDEIMNQINSLPQWQKDIIMKIIWF